MSGLADRAVVGYAVQRAPAPHPLLGPEELRMFQRDSWAAVAAAVSCWPDLPAAVERRVLVEHGKTRELIYAAAPLLDPADREELEADLRALLEPLWPAYPVRPLSREELAASLDASWTADVAEALSLSERAPEGVVVFVDTLGRLVRSIGQEARALISMVVETPAPPVSKPEESELPLFMGIPVSFSQSPAAPHHRPIHFRLGLASERRLRAATVASGAALMFDSADCAGTGWRRPGADAPLWEMKAQLAQVAAARSPHAPLTCTMAAASVLSLATMCSNDPADVVPTAELRGWARALGSLSEEDIDEISAGRPPAGARCSRSGEQPRGPVADAVSG